MTIMGHDAFLRHQRNVQGILPLFEETKPQRWSRRIGIASAILAVSTLAYMGGHVALASQPTKTMSATAYFGAIASKDLPNARLIGFGCGAKSETLLAMEEDQFPRCASIEAVRDACRIQFVRGDDGKGGFKEILWETLPANQCRDYWGDGY
jgi:hypothetical protein